MAKIYITYVFAPYHFPDGHNNKAEPHGNAKSDQAFHPTWPSVIVQLASQSKTTDSSNDELFVVMSQCKSKDVTAHFIRDVKDGPDPALVIATDKQLNDLVKFCTSPDPTFNLGDFKVTLITYQHLFLQSEHTGKSPVFNADPL